MSAFRTGLFAAAALVLLAGCADDYGYRAAYVAGGPVGDYAYDGYYDDYYGPYYGGYWAGDGFFYFSDARGRYHRDADRHFRREAVQGFHPFHGHPPSQQHWRDHDHDR